MAKDYIRSKKHVQKFMLMRTQLQGVGLQLQVRGARHRARGRPARAAAAVCRCPPAPCADPAALPLPPRRCAARRR